MIRLSDAIRMHSGGGPSVAPMGPPAPAAPMRLSEALARYGGGGVAPMGPPLPSGYAPPPTDTFAGGGQDIINQSPGPDFSSQLPPDPVGERIGQIGRAYVDHFRAGKLPNYTVVPKSGIPDWDDLQRQQREMVGHPAGTVYQQGFLPPELHAFDLGDGQNALIPTVMAQRIPGARLLHSSPQAEEKFRQLAAEEIAAIEQATGGPASPEVVLGAQNAARERVYGVEPEAHVTREDIATGMGPDNSALENFSGGYGSAISRIYTGGVGVFDKKAAAELQRDYGAIFQHEKGPASMAGGVLGTGAMMAPALAGGAAVPAVAAVAGAAAFGNKRGEIQRLREDENAQISTGQELTAAAGNAAAETLLELFGLKVLGKIASGIGAKWIPDLIGGIAARDAASTSRALARIAVDVGVKAGGSGAVEESLTTLAQNAVDRSTYDPDRSLGQGLPEAAAMGYGGGVLLGGAGAAMHSYAGRAQSAPLLPPIEQAAQAQSPAPAAPEPLAGIALEPLDAEPTQPQPQPDPPPLPAQTAPGVEGTTPDLATAPPPITPPASSSQQPAEAPAAATEDGRPVEGAAFVPPAEGGQPAEPQIAPPSPVPGPAPKGDPHERSPTPAPVAPSSETPEHLTGEPAAPAAPQPWSMGSEDYRKALFAEHREAGKPLYLAERASREHAQLVADAVARGEDVPDHVLDEYPQLDPVTMETSAILNGRTREDALDEIFAKLGEENVSQSQRHRLETLASRLMTDEEAGLAHEYSPLPPAVAIARRKAAEATQTPQETPSVPATPKSVQPANAPQAKPQAAPRSRKKVREPKQYRVLVNGKRITIVSKEPGGKWTNADHPYGTDFTTREEAQAYIDERFTPKPAPPAETIPPPPAAPSSPLGPELQAAKQEALADVREQAAKPVSEQEPNPELRPVGEAKPKKARKRKGFVDLTPTIEVIEHVAAHPIAGTAQLAKRGLDKMTKPLTAVVGDQAGATGKEIQQLALAATDRSKALMGQFDETLRPALHAASGGSRLSRQGVDALSGITWSPSGEYGVTRFRDAVEGRIANLSPAETSVVGSFRKLMEQTGKAAADAGVLAYDPTADEWVPFTPARDGKRLIRKPTEELWDVLQAGPNSPAYDVLARALAEMNGMTQPAALQQLDALRERALVRRAAFEAFRVFERFPDYIRVNGQVAPLLHAHPFEAARQVAHSTALRLGYVSQFGQDLPDEVATPHTSRQLLERFVRDGGRREDLEDLTRALNGMQVRPMESAAPGSALYEAGRSARFLKALIRPLLLSKSALPNLVEPYAKIPALVGVRRMAMALADMALHPRVIAVETARLGARTADVLNMTVEPTRKREGVGRIVSGVGMRLNANHFVNEFNELWAAAAARRFMNDLRDGHTHFMDAERLRIMEFTDDQIHQLMTRSAPDELYQAVAIRSPELTQGTTSAPAQQSKASHNRVYRAIVWFDGYARTTINRTARVVRNLGEAFRSGDKKRMAAASGVAATYFFGAGVSGASAMFLLALVAGGTKGLLIRKEEAEDDPADFMLEALRYSLLAGPLEAIGRGLASGEDADGALRVMSRAAPPLSMLMEARDMFRGDGGYRDRTFGERLSRFLKGHVPISGPAATALVAGGWKDGDNGREAAINAYWRWRRDNDKLFKIDPPDDEVHSQFRMHMRRAAEAIRRNAGPDEVNRHVAEALKVEGKDHKNAAQSIRGKRLLASMKDEDKDALRRHVGAFAYEKLEEFDGLLDGWALAVNPVEAAKNELAAGLKQDVRTGSAAMVEAVKSGRITAAAASDVEKRVELTPFQYEFHKLDAEKAMERWRKLGPAGRKPVTNLVAEKVDRSKSITEPQRQAMLEELGVLKPAGVGR